MITIIQPENDRENIPDEVLLEVLSKATSVTIKTFGGEIKLPRKIEVNDGTVTITVRN